MLTVSNLSFSYPDSSSSALCDINFSIKKGEYAVILGTNGSGKSTLARLVAGFLKPSSGKIDFDKDLLSGIVFQSPKEQVVSGIVNHDTAFGPKNLGLSQSETEQRVIECLSATDLLDKALSSTSALSLGQTQKLATSGILALHPDLLILDEATSMLDPDSRKELLDYIDSSHEHGQTILHITHDYSEALKSSHVIVLNKGKIIFDGATEEFKNHQEIIHELYGDPIPANPRNKKLNEEIILSMKNISFSYNNDKAAGKNNSDTLKNFNLQIQKGTLTAITGPSGSGKSTVLELIAGLLTPSEGKINCKIRPALALQDCSAALFEAFAADDVAFGPKNQGIKGKELKKLVKDCMNRVGLPFEEFADRGTYMLSGGEKHKLAIAGIIAMNSDVILFDEPTSGLDPKSRRLLLEQLRSLTESGKTVVFSTHRMEEADFADRHIAMKGGKIVSDSQNVEVLSELPEAPVLQGTGLLERLRKTEIFGEDPSSHKKNIFQKIGPAAKYCIFLSLFTLSLLFSDVKLSAGMLALTLLYGILARFPVKKYFSSFLVILPWMIFFCGFQLIFSIPEENDVLYAQLGWFTITRSKIIACINLVIHTFSALSCARVFLYSTAEQEFLEGLTKIFKPLSYIKIPVREIIVIIEIIFRFIPLLIEESCSIVKTQIVRGGLGKADSIWKKIRIILPLFIPLIIQTVKRSEALADALTARKF